MSDEKLAELAGLLQTQLDGTTDEVTKHRLAELLRGDPAAQAYYVKYCQLHAMLAWEHGVLTEVEANGFTQSEIPTTIKSKSQPDSRFWRVFAIAATIMLAVAGSWFGYHRFTQNAQQIANSLDPGARADLVPTIAWEARENLAVVSKNRGARLLVTDLALELVTGDQVRSGVYDLAGGFVELTFGNGVEVIIESPASFEIESEMRMVLHVGRLSAIVSELGEGFTVETPSADVVDFGTEFAIEVSRDGDGDDEFHVFQGEVVVKPRSSGSIRRVELIGGQATRLDHRTTTPAGIDIDHRRFVRNFDTAPLDYYQQVMKLKPDVYYVMRIVNEGKTLRNEIDERGHAEIFSSDKNYLPWAPGFNGGTALKTNGANSGTYAVAMDYPKAQGDQLSVVAWVYAESRPIWASIAKNWEHGLAPVRRGQFHFGLLGLSGVLEAHINDDDNVEQFVEDTLPLPLNRWHHVAMVADGNILRLYRNGKEVAATHYNGLNGNPRIKPLAIGNKLGDDSISPSRPLSGAWDGCIDHFSIFNKALTPDQIQQLFESGDASIKNFQSVQKQD